SRARAPVPWHRVGRRPGRRPTSIPTTAEGAFTVSAEVRISTLIEPVLAPLVVDEVKVTPAGKRRVVRIAVDRATDEGAVVDTASEPMSLDEIADATRAVSAALD